MRDVCLEALVFAEGDDAHAIQAARSAAKKTVKAMSACPMNRVTGENVNKEDTFWQRLGAEKCSAFVDVVVKRLTEMRRRPGDQALLPRGPSGAPEPAPDLLLHDGIRRADEVFRRGPQPHPQAHEGRAEPERVPLPRAGQALRAGRAGAVRAGVPDVLHAERAAAPRVLQVRRTHERPGGALSDAAALRHTRPHFGFTQSTPARAGPRGPHGPPTTRHSTARCRARLGPRRSPCSRRPKRTRTVPAAQSRHASVGPAPGSAMPARHDPIALTLPFQSPRELGGGARIRFSPCRDPLLPRRHPRRAIPARHASCCIAKRVPYPGRLPARCTLLPQHPRRSSSSCLSQRELPISTLRRLGPCRA